MTFAYADPPYPGMAHYYGCPEVDHGALVKDLCDHYPDGWALSTASTTLQQVLALCPPDVRIGAWVKPFASFKPGVNPAYAWEPVIFRGGRKRDRDVLTVRDWCAESITLRRGFTGAKPEAFCWWLFELMGMQPDAMAAACYALPDEVRDRPAHPKSIFTMLDKLWPTSWRRSDFKPSGNRIHELVKAGALIAAEIDRLQRKQELCPSCICKRLHDAGIRDVPAAFFSGPIRSVSYELMYTFRRVENLEERMAVNVPARD